MPKSKKRSGILDPQDLGSGIVDPIFSFSHGILKILDPVTAVLPWDPKDPGSWISDKNILLVPGGPGSSLSKLSCDLADLGSCTTIRSLYFEHRLQPMAFCFWFPISMRCLRLSTVKNFNHTLIHPFYVDLEAGSPCWLLNMFPIIDVLLTGCCRNEMNAHFITS